MIELNRYVRVKPDGLAKAVPTDDDGGGIYVYFKRFDVENGREIEPERSFLSWADIERHLAECEAHAAVLREFMALRAKA